MCYPLTQYCLADSFTLYIMYNLLDVHWDVLNNTLSHWKASHNFFQSYNYSVNMLQTWGDLPVYGQSFSARPTWQQPSSILNNLSCHSSCVSAYYTNQASSMYCARKCIFSMWSCMDTLVPFCWLLSHKFYVSASLQVVVETNIPEIFHRGGPQVCLEFRILFQLLLSNHNFSIFISRTLKRGVAQIPTKLVSKPNSWIVFLVPRLHSSVSHHQPYFQRDFSQCICKQLWVISVGYR